MPENKPKRDALFGRLTLAELKISPVALHGLITPPTVVEKIISIYTECTFFYPYNTAVVPEA